MKRFYKLVSTGSDFTVLLDGKPVKTPGGKPLRASTAALAEAVMAEWAAQADVIDPENMPLTQVLTTAIDRVMAERPAMTAQVLNYLDTDLLCYRAAGPEELTAAQAAQWDGALDWFAACFGTKLETTTSLAALRHPAAAHKAVAEYVAALDDDRFTILQMVVSITGSLILAMAFMEGARDANALLAAIHVEEDYKAKLYNEDFYGRAPHQEKREAGEHRDLHAAQRFLACL